VGAFLLLRFLQGFYKGVWSMKRDLLKNTLSSRTFRLSRIALVSMAVAAQLLSAPAMAKDKIEKPDVKFGFIKLTDMVPLAVAYEKGYFEDEGLFVTLEAQANWKVLLDRVISGELDGAHMLAGQPIGATIGYGTKAEVITAISMDLNGNGITVSNAVMEKLKAVLPKQPDGKPVHPI
jgi:nitrate/nitrite transport system substrate-binding protein